MGSGGGNPVDYEVWVEFVINAHSAQWLSLLQATMPQVYDYTAKEWTDDCGGGGEQINPFPSHYTLNCEFPSLVVR